MIVSAVDVEQYNRLIVTDSSERTTAKQWGLGVMSAAGAAVRKVTLFDVTRGV